jgi:hypothetical protein
MGLVVGIVYHRNLWANNRKCNLSTIHFLQVLEEQLGLLEGQLELLEEQLELLVDLSVLEPLA